MAQASRATNHSLIPAFEYWERERDWSWSMLVLFSWSSSPSLQWCWDLCMHLPSALRVAGCQENTTRVVCQNLSSQWQQEGGEVTARAPQPGAMPPCAMAEAGLQPVCGTGGDGLFSTAWISQSGISEMRRPWIFDGLPEISSKLTPAKVLLWIFIAWNSEASCGLSSWIFL